MWPVQSQEWKVKLFFVPQATNSIWRRETRTMATPMRSLSVGIAKSVRESFLDRRGRGFDDCVHRQKHPETISFEVRSIEIDQKRSV